MARGRRRVPEELQRLKGNPRKRKLSQLAPAEPVPASQPTAAAPSPAEATRTIQVPAELRSERERAIFRSVVEELMPRNMVRETDFRLVIRYARFFHLWLQASEALYQANDATVYKVESKWGTYYRRFPAVKDMLDFHEKLFAMEQQIGMTPVARTTLLARMMAPGAQPSGGLFASEPKQEKAGDGEAPDGEKVAADADLEAALSPLGFLQRAAGSNKPH